MENEIWQKLVWIYFDILKDVNKNYRSLIKLLKNNNRRKIVKKYYEIMEEITQIIPYGYIEKENELKLNKYNGILELISDDVPLINKKMNELLIKYKDELISIKIIRNNIEHSPHKLLYLYQINCLGSSDINISFCKKNINLKDVGNKDIDFCYCNTDILKTIITELNTLFKDIRKIILKEINDESLINYYKRCKLKI